MDGSDFFLVHSQEEQHPIQYKYGGVCLTLRLSSIYIFIGMMRELLDVYKKDCSTVAN